MAKVEIYTWKYCPFCIRAKSLLNQKSISFQEYPIDGDEAARQLMSKKADGRSTVPQIFINGKGIGGCDELYALERNNQLDVLIKENQDAQ